MKNVSWFTVKVWNSFVCWLKLSLSFLIFNFRLDALCFKAKHAVSKYSNPKLLVSRGLDLAWQPACCTFGLRFWASRVFVPVDIISKILLTATIPLPLKRIFKQKQGYRTHLNRGKWLNITQWSQSPCLFLVFFYQIQKAGTITFHCVLHTGRNPVKFNGKRK